MRPRVRRKKMTMVFALLSSCTENPTLFTTQQASVAKLYYLSFCAPKQSIDHTETWLVMGIRCMLYDAAAKSKNHLHNH